MNTPDLTFTLLVDQSPEEAFNAITNVPGWWSENIEGNTEQLNDEFIYRYKDMHYSKQRLVELVPNQKIVWLVTESQLYFLENKDEWTGTKISFDISRHDDKTQVLFTHIGLTPGVECYNACLKGWGQYVQHSLLSLITTGVGQPDKKQTETAVLSINS
jgi:hypothetical protein